MVTLLLQYFTLLSRGHETSRKEFLYHPPARHAIKAEHCSSKPDLHTKPNLSSGPDPSQTKTSQPCFRLCLEEWTKLSFHGGWMGPGNFCLTMLDIQNWTYFFHLTYWRKAQAPFPYYLEQTGASHKEKAPFQKEKLSSQKAKAAFQKEKAFLSGGESLGASVAGRNWLWVGNWRREGTGDWDSLPHNEGKAAAQLLLWEGDAWSIVPYKKIISECHHHRCWNGKEDKYMQLNSGNKPR